MKKVFIVALSLLCVVVIGTSAFALDNSPFAGGVYISCHTAEIGDIVIYLPVNYRENTFTLKGAEPFNMTSSSISCVLYSGPTEYYGRFNSFGTFSFRSSDNYSYTDLTIDDVYETNVVFTETFEYTDPLDDNVVILIVIGLLGVIALCLFLKKY